MRYIRSTQLSLNECIFNTLKAESLNHMFLEPTSEHINTISGDVFMPVIRINSIGGHHEFHDTRVGFESAGAAYDQALDLIERYHAWAGHNL